MFSTLPCTPPRRFSLLCPIIRPQIHSTTSSRGRRMLLVAQAAVATPHGAPGLLLARVTYATSVIAALRACTPVSNTMKSCTPTLIPERSPLLQANVTNATSATSPLRARITIDDTTKPRTRRRRYCTSAGSVGKTLVVRPHSNATSTMGVMRCLNSVFFK